MLAIHLPQPIPVSCSDGIRSATFPMAPPAAVEVVVGMANKDAGAKEQTPLEAISHGEVMPGIPDFPRFSDHRRHILIHMAAVFRHFARSGYTEGQSGHISVRDPEFASCMWMNPLGRHFGQLTAGDMLLIHIPTGAIVCGRANPATQRRTANAAGVLIHAAIHVRRPDVHAVCHAHTAAGRAWAAWGLPLHMLHQDACTLYGAHAVYARYGGIVFGAEEGQRIATALGPANKALILLNHGLLTVGRTVDEAGFLFGLLERCCAIQLQVEAAAGPGMTRHVIADDEAAYNFRMASEPHALYREAQPDIEFEMELAGGEAALAKGVESFEHITMPAALQDQ